MANRKTPSPFKVRGKWRAQVTLKNGHRPCKDFENLEDAKQYIADTLSNHNSEHDPRLGGPTQATLADALTATRQQRSRSKRLGDSRIAFRASRGRPEHQNSRAEA